MKRSAIRSNEFFWFQWHPANILQIPQIFPQSEVRTFYVCQSNFWWCLFDFWGNTLSKNSGCGNGYNFGTLGQKQLLSSHFMFISLSSDLFLHRKVISLICFSTNPDLKIQSLFRSGFWNTLKTLETAFQWMNDLNDKFIFN